MGKGQIFKIEKFCTKFFFYGELFLLESKKKIINKVINKKNLNRPERKGLLGL